MAVKYAVTILFDNAQSAHVLAERIAKEMGVVVDVIGRQEIATYHPPVKEWTDTMVQLAPGVKNDG